jgi:hypothetical protein
MDKVRIAVGEYFDRREAAARKDGNKKIVDELKADRPASAGHYPMDAMCSCNKTGRLS